MVIQKKHDAAVMITDGRRQEKTDPEELRVRNIQEHRRKNQIKSRVKRYEKAEPKINQADASDMPYRKADGNIWITDRQKGFGNTKKGRAAESRGNVSGQLKNRKETRGRLSVRTITRSVEKIYTEAEAASDPEHCGVRQNADEAEHTGEKQLVKNVKKTVVVIAKELFLFAKLVLVAMKNIVVTCIISSVIIAAIAVAACRASGIDAEAAEGRTAAMTGQFVWPAEGCYYVTSPFGQRESPGGIGSTNHKGIDISCATGTNVLAAAAGTVVTAAYSESAGNWIVIDHGDYQTEYMHNSSLAVGVGDVVNAGDVIASAGSTGHSTGPHCHFGVIVDGERVDPAPYFEIPSGSTGDMSAYIHTGSVTVAGIDGYTEEDVRYLAACIYLEAGGGYDAELAVGTVVMNRLSSPAYPDTLQGVIMARGQFEVTWQAKWSSTLANPPDAAVSCAQDILQGKRSGLIPENCYSFRGTDATGAMNGSRAWLAPYDHYFIQNVGGSLYQTFAW